MTYQVKKSLFGMGLANPNLIKEEVEAREQQRKERKIEAQNLHRQKIIKKQRADAFFCYNCQNVCIASKLF